MGQPAARVTDPIAHKGAAGAVLEGESSVLIGGLPAARLGDAVAHGAGREIIVEGESSVLIAGRPAARVADKVACSGLIIGGCGSVLIGLNALGECVKEAGDSGAAMVGAQ